MLTHLHVRNFKSWHDTGTVRLAPITGFFGANSSGKTALLQFLLLLKQTAEAIDFAAQIAGDTESGISVAEFAYTIHSGEVMYRFGMQTGGNHKSALCLSHS